MEKLWKLHMFEWVPLVAALNIHSQFEVRFSAIYLSTYFYLLQGGSFIGFLRFVLLANFGFVHAVVR